MRFIFDVQDAFSEVTQSLGLDWLGTFSPDVAIHAGRNLAGTVGAVSQENTASSPTNMICSVQDVRFSDGRVWKKGARSAPVAPGLYYPPTPAPNAKPQAGLWAGGAVLAAPPIVYGPACSRVDR